MNADRLVNRIRREIERRLLTQAEVARMAGLSPQRVNSLLRGKHSGRKTIRAILDALSLRDAS